MKTGRRRGRAGTGIISNIRSLDQGDPPPQLNHFLNKIFNFIFSDSYFYRVFSFFNIIMKIGEERKVSSSETTMPYSINA